MSKPDPEQMKAKLDTMAREAATCKAAAEHAEAMQAAQADRPPYEVLGLDGKQVVIYSRERKRLAFLPAERVTMDALSLMIAPRPVLAAYIPGGEEMQPRQLAAAVRDDIAAKLGSRVYNPAKVRGAGIWQDSEGVLYSTGRDCYLLREGESTPRPVYPMRPDGTLYAAEVNKAGMPAPAPLPLTPTEGKALFSFLEARAWAETYAADILAGWVLCSMLGGILPIRPHLWINGARGSGKSALNADLRALFGGGCHTPAGAESTTAGVRRTVEGSALPVLYDESETDGRESKVQRMQNLLSMARLSTDGNQCSPRAKEGGGVHVAVLRSCFCLFSIRDFLEQEADYNRFHLLNVRHVSPAEVALLRQKQAEGRKVASCPDTPARLLTLAMQQAGHILRNAATIAARLEGAGIESRRALIDGVLLAARWALTDGGEASAHFLECCDTIARAAEEKAADDDSPEWARLQDHIMGYLCMTAPVKMNVRQAGQAALWGVDPDTISRAESALKSLGMHPGHVNVRRKDGRAGQGCVTVEHGSRAFKPVLEGSRWRGGHGIVSAIEGAPDAEMKKCRLPGSGRNSCYLVFYEGAFRDNIEEAEE